MSIPAVWPQVLDFFGTPLVIEPSAGQLSGDAGLLPLRQFDQGIGLTRAFADALDDPRDLGLTEHSFLEMVRSRVHGILAGYADQKDHDTLRHDPVFGLTWSCTSAATAASACQVCATWPSDRYRPYPRRQYDLGERKL
jgi:hypothetical protein